MFGALVTVLKYNVHDNKNKVEYSLRIFVTNDGYKNAEIKIKLE